MTLQDAMTLFLVLLFLVAAFVYERWAKARAGGISGVFRRLAEWRRMSVAEKAARKELEAKMERQRQEEARAKRETEENRRQNADVAQELVHPETGTRWRWAREPWPGHMRYVQHLDGDRWVTVTASKSALFDNEILENHIKDDKGKRKNTSSKTQTLSAGWYWYGKQGWGVQLNIDYRSGVFSVNGLESSPPVGQTEEIASSDGLESSPAVGQTEEIASSKETGPKETRPEGKRPDRLEMLD